MEDARFDRLAQKLGGFRSRRAVTRLLGGFLIAPVLAGAEVDARKKKQKCARKCATGCCTSKYGKCLQPAQQSVSQCGTGGAVCQRSGCRECTAERLCPPGQCCSGSGVCGACLVFVTSTVRNANLGGLTGADGICQDLANVAGLPGRYLAWLSDSTASPSTRFTRATASYTLVDGTSVADSWSDLTSGTLNHAIDTSETNSAIPSNVYCWTNTLPDGTAGGALPNSTCGNWTSTNSNAFGNSGRLTAIGDWTEGSASNCSLPIRLYCFQQAS